MMWLESRLDSGMGFVLIELQKIQNESVSRLDFCSPFSCSILGMIAVDPARLNSTAASENPPSVVSAIATQRSMVRKHQCLVERAHGNRNSADESWTVGAERSAAPTAPGNYRALSSQRSRVGLTSFAPTGLGRRGVSFIRYLCSLTDEIGRE
jgi:hypothetical protein